MGPIETGGAISLIITGLIPVVMISRMGVSFLALQYVTLQPNVRMLTFMVDVQTEAHSSDRICFSSSGQ